MWRLSKKFSAVIFRRFDRKGFQNRRYEIGTTIHVQVKDIRTIWVYFLEMIYQANETLLTKRRCLHIFLNIIAR